MIVEIASWIKHGRLRIILTRYLAISGQLTNGMMNVSISLNQIKQKYPFTERGAIMILKINFWLNTGDNHEA